MLGGISGIGSYSTYYMNPYRDTLRARNAAAPARQTETAQRTGGTDSAWSVRKPSNLETPVQPVDAVRKVNPDAQPVGIDQPLSIRQGADPAEMAVRMRMTAYEDGEEDFNIFANGEEDYPGIFGEEENAAELGIFGKPEDEEGLNVPGSEEKDAQSVDGAQGAEDAQEAAEEGKCETCEKRKYQDGSDDMSVSFQSPTNIKPGQVAAAVRGHEMEHVLHEQAKAKREGRRVVSQSVTLHTAICPECGKVYISGGETRTTTKANPEPAGTEDQKESGDGLRKSFSMFG